MGNIGDAISESVPAVGSSGPTYASTINALLTEFKTRMTARIPLSSLLATSDLDLNGEALLNAGYITLTNEGVSPVASPSNRIAAYAGNLWWVSPSGALQITSGATLNAAGVGGITGDYSGAGPMEFRYDTANTRYDAFANQSTNTWAYVRARGFDIAGSATSAFRLRFNSSVTANASLTWGDASADNGILTVASGTVAAVEAIDQNEQTYFVEHYKTYGALELFHRGYFTGAGVASVNIDGNDAYYYNLSLATGTVTLQIPVETEVTTASLVNPLTVTAIKWKGLINGGGYPTLQVLAQTSGTPPFNLTAPALDAQTLSAQTTATGAMQTVYQTLVTPLQLVGDEMLFARVIAGTNNCDTYSVTLYFSKQS